ncbi:MAG: chemotaxis response regulator protein-glutamate methylesterase [Armatimonadota bacterium]|nr:chemotaxis response regulator protein-glutamate methylesterase [Armatimonadota bacterium]
MSRQVRVLVVDDSAYVRKVVRQMLSRSPSIEVVGSARDGREALDLVERLQPDVVTLDLIMPVMDGLSFLNEQMKRRPLPVVVVSIASEGGAQALAALDAGAIDFVQKPTALATEKILEISEELVQKVTAAAEASVAKLPSVAPVPAPSLGAPRGAGLVDLVAIGVSTGGPQALRVVIPALPATFPVPIAIVLHMPVGYTAMYAARLDSLSALRVVEAREGDSVQPGTVLLAPAGRHLTFRQTHRGVVAHLDARPFDTPHRPSVDVLFRSAAETYGARVLGVVMTGMGSDGREGAAWIKAQGGIVFTEAEESCVVYGMPRAVVEAGLSDRAVSLPQLASAILEVV